MEQPRKGTSVTARACCALSSTTRPAPGKAGKPSGGLHVSPHGPDSQPSPFCGPRHTRLAALITGSGEPLTPVSSVQPHTPVSKGSS